MYKCTAMNYTFILFINVSCIIFFAEFQQSVSLTCLCRSKAPQLQMNHLWLREGCLL